MQSTQIYAFFMEPMVSKWDFDLHGVESFTWINFIRRTLNQPIAHVHLVDSTEWIVPDIKYQQPIDALKEIVRIAAGMVPYLESHGVPKDTIIYSAHKIKCIDIPEFEVLCFIFEYSSLW